MAQTTGAVSGSNGKVTALGIDISGSKNKISIRMSKAIGKTHTFAGAGAVGVVGKEDGNGVLSVVYTEVPGEAQDRLYTAWKNGTVVPLVGSPKGGSVGDWNWSVAVLLKDWPLEFDANSPGPMKVDWNFEVIGEIVKGAVT